MKKLVLTLFILVSQLSLGAEEVLSEDYYVTAFNEISDMLYGKDSLSIKRATYLAEWAYYEGKLDYKKDFCDEIDRIVRFVKRFYSVNKLSSYKTGKQMALNEYFFRPYSGNGFKPYTYNYEDFFKGGVWERQFVSEVLKTHKGQCRSLPWMYRILAKEIGADVALAHAPGHTYIMYKDEDNLTPEDWINLELTTHQMTPEFWIKEDFEICDSAVIVGTYMSPLTEIQTVACQMSDLAFGYHEKFKRYDKFTLYCASRSLEFYPMNPNAWLIRNKSLLEIAQDYLDRNGSCVDDYVSYLIHLLEETKLGIERTHMTIATEEFLERKYKQAKESQKYYEENLLPK